MKKFLAFSLICSFIINGCKDKNDPTPPATANNYQPMTTNSSWSYKVENKINPSANFNFTLKATTKDTSINSKTYKVFTNTSADNEYYYRNGTDYQQFGGFAGLTNSIELTYLKDATVGTTWSETKAVTVANVLSVTAIFNYTIAEKLATYSLNSLNFQNVYRVNISVVVPGMTFSTQEVNFYYASNVGRIKSQIKMQAAPPFNTTVNFDNETSITAYTIVP